MSTDVMTKTREKENAGVNVKMLVKVGMLAAVSVILMQFEIPLPFAPVFYKIDFSEVPVLIGCFAMGPLAGVLAELVKVILNMAVSGTTTMGVGDFANFLIGCSMCIPAAVVYRKNHTKKGAAAGLVLGTVFMTVIGCLLNAYVLLPVYARAFEMPMDALIEMGAAVNGSITNLMTFVLLAVAPFNLLKGVLVSLTVLVIYKKISRILH